MSEKKKKGMKKNEKIVILVLVIILVAVIILAVVRNNSNSDTEETETSSSTESSETEDTSEEEGEYSMIVDDGTKLNTSDKLHEDKELDGLEITEIQLTSSDNVTQFLATVINTSDEVQGGYIATITLLDADGNELIALKPYIQELEPDESTQLNVSAVFDYSDAYDFTITK